MKDYTKGKSPEMLEPFFPNELFRHVIVSCFLVIIELVAVVLFPLPLKVIEKPDYIPWFFLPIYKLNKLIQNEVMFISILVLCVLMFITWPFLVSGRKYSNTEGKNASYDRYVKGRRYLWQRPIPFTIVIITIVFVILLCFISP
ncbi:MAG: hypothetical protein ACK41Q_06865 [Candidatus Brocadia sp.]